MINALPLVLILFFTMCGMAAVIAWFIVERSKLQTALDEMLSPKCTECGSVQDHAALKHFVCLSCLGAD